MNPLSTLKAPMAYIGETQLDNSAEMVRASATRGRRRWRGAILVLGLLLRGVAWGQEGPQLWIRDDINDLGNEPNNETTYFYISDDIWVRRQADPNYDPTPYPTGAPTWVPLPHEGPCYRDPKTSSPNFIYVRIRNRGNAPSSGTETLHVYWAKASTGLGWSGDWIDHVETPSCGGPPKLYGYEVTKPRKSAVAATAGEQADYVTAVQTINAAPYLFPDGITYFNKQNNVHFTLFNLGIHNSLRFLPWHREFINRYEALLREVKPTLTLLYWDWTTDPSPGIIGAGGFMGVANGAVGAPFAGWGLARAKSALAPGGFAAGLAPGYQTGTLIPSGDYPTFWSNIEVPSHNSAHRYIGSTMASMSAASDPVFFMLHANCDRLWAMWQRALSSSTDRWNPARAYNPSMADPAITGDLRPWDGTDGISPWTLVDGYIIHKKPTSHSIVYPPVYDDVALKVPVIPGGYSCIIELPFYPPPLTECAGFGDPGHVCLLARIEPVNVPEGPDLGTNVKNNRKIAWKNVRLTDCNVGPWMALAAGRVGGIGELIRNPLTAVAQTTLRFNAIQTGFLSPFDYGRVRLRLEKNLYEAWIKGGVKGTGVEPVGTNNEVFVLNSGATLAGLVLGPRELGHIDAALELDRNYQPPFGDVYYLDLEQYDNLHGTNVVGAQRYTLDFNLLGLLNRGSDWKFLEAGQNPGAGINWTTLGYDDKGWRTGSAPFGFGRPDAVTSLMGSNGQPTTAYFRQTFYVADPTFYHSLHLNLVQDDGLVVYLNGKEVTRLNLPADNINPDTPALTPVTGAAAHAYRSVDLSNSLNLLIVGTNILAAEMHPFPQDYEDYFDLGLDANVPIYPYQPPAVVINSPLNGGLYRIGGSVQVQADAVDPDGDLASVRIYSDNALLATLTAPPFVAAIQPNTLGTHRVSVQAVDQRGNQTRMEAVFAVLSNLPPVVSMTAPLNMPMLPAGSPVQLAADAHDSDGEIVEVAFYVRTHGFGDPPRLVSVSKTPPYTAVAQNLESGHYLAFAVAMDNQGATASALPVDFMINQPPGTPDLRLQFADLGGAPVMTLEWDDESAVLEYGPTVAGPWTSIPSATPPYSVDPRSMTAQFFRLRLQ